MTLKQHQWWIPLKKNIDLGKTSFNISVNAGQIVMGFEAYRRFSAIVFYLPLHKF